MLHTKDSLSPVILGVNCHLRDEIGPENYEEMIMQQPRALLNLIFCLQSQEFFVLSPMLNVYVAILPDMVRKPSSSLIYVIPSAASEANSGGHKTTDRTLKWNPC